MDIDNIDIDDNIDKFDKSIIDNIANTRNLIQRIFLKSCYKRVVSMTKKRFITANSMINVNMLFMR